MTNSLGTHASPTRLPRSLAVGIVLVTFIIVGAVAGQLFIRGRSAPASGTVEWHLGDLDPVTTQTATVIPISIDEWPVESCYAPATAWLEAPEITYTPSSVVITMHKTDAYAHAHCAGFYTTNWSGNVQLSEPLGGRALFDGSTSPPDPRPLRSAVGTVLILGVADWQGQLDPLSGIGGAGALATYFKQDRAAGRAANEGILTVATGNDVSPGPPLSTFFQDTPAIMSERMMGVMVGTFGNHNFDAGIGRLQSQVDLAYADASDGDTRFHYVASNLSNRDANLEGTEDYEIFRYGDVKYAVIGIVNDDAPTTVPPGSFGTMTPTDGVAAAMAAKAAAKAAGADVFIALTDKGVTNDSAANPTGGLVDFANAVSGFDLILGGSTDVQYQGTINGQLVVENRSKGLTYSKTLLTYDRLAARMTAASTTFVSPAAAAVTADPRVVAMLGTYQAQMSLLVDGTPETARPAPAPTSSTFSQDKSAACLTAKAQVPAFALRLAEVGLGILVPTLGQACGQWRDKSPEFATLPKVAGQ